MTANTSFKSSAERTNERAIQSAPNSNAIFKSVLSWSVKGGTSKVMPGKLTPFRGSTKPPITALHLIVCLETVSTT